MHLDGLLVKILAGGILVRFAPYIIWEALKFLLICAIIYTVVKVYPLMDRVRPLLERQLGDRVWLLQWVTQKLTAVTNQPRIPPNYKSLGVKELRNIVRENKIKVPTVGSGKDGRIVKYDLIEAIRNM